MSPDLPQYADPATLSISSAMSRLFSFAYESTVKRWPAILTQVIDSIYAANHALSYSRTNQSARIAEGKEIIEKIASLKHDMSRDRPLTPINVDRSNPEEQDDGPTTELFDRTIQEQAWSWFSAPWLFAECYLYRLLRSFFARSTHWKRYDPFSKSKLQTFRSSGTAISELANTIEGLIKKANSAEKGAESTPEGREILFHEMAQMSLWGNATDLSLLTSLSYADLQALQTTGKEQQEARAKFILSNDLDKAWKQISSLDNGRIDIVLDNAGFELVSDMIFADWLLSTPHVGEVVFHPKNMPWFVSDVTPPDFRHTIESLLEPSFFVKQQEEAEAERHRSVSRTRDLQADASQYSYSSTGAQGASHPAGSRQLRMAATEDRGRSPHPAGSRSLQAREGSVDTTGRGRAPSNTRTFQMDPAYFRNARSQTISPSRSYVVDSSLFSSLSIHDEVDGDEGHSRGRSTTVKDETPSSQTPVQAMVRRWMGYLETGRFKLSVPLDTPLGSDTGALNGFWTLPTGYANMAELAPELHAELRAKSGLVIFKGDLNYRKLTSDAVWPSTTTFREALGPLAGSLEILALRTNKADVCVGLKEGQEEWVEKQDSKWRVNGKWAVVQYCPRDN
ncbi:Hairy/enhancer-of-split with YRPW motif protein 2 [Thecaphora frezii]